MGLFNRAVQQGPICVEAEVGDYIYIREGNEEIRRKELRVVDINRTGVYVSFRGYTYFVREADYTLSTRGRR